MWCQLRWWPFVCLPGKEDQSIEWRDRIVFFFYRKLPETGYQRQRWRRGKNKFKHFQYFAAGNCHQHRVSLLGARVADVTDRCVHLEEMEAPFAVGPFSSSVSFRTLFANPQVVFFFLVSPAADGNCLCWPLQKLRMINFWRHSSGSMFLLFCRAANWFTCWCIFQKICLFKIFEMSANWIKLSSQHRNKKKSGKLLGTAGDAWCTRAALLARTWSMSCTWRRRSR